MNDPRTHLNIRQETFIDKNFPRLFLFDGTVWYI